MGFFKTSLAVTTGIIGSIGLLSFAKHLNESGAIDKVKARLGEAVEAVSNKKAAGKATD